MSRAALARDVATNTALVLPPVRRYYERRRLSVGHDVMTHDAAYAASVFEKHRAVVERIGPIRGRVLEVGPGGSTAVAALFVRSGAASAVCIDSEPWLSDDRQIHEELGLGPDVLERVTYEWPCAVETAPFDDESFDLVFSHACFEHFADPGAAIANIARMLRPGGVTTHQIDLRDHRDFDDPLRFLRHRDLTWRLATSRKYSAPNRWRMPDYVRAFEAAGLEIAVLERDGTVDVTEADRRSFAPRFRRMSLDDLGTTGIFLAATKPA